MSTPQSGDGRQPGRPGDPFPPAAGGASRRAERDTSFNPTAAAGPYGDQSGYPAPVIPSAPGGQFTSGGQPAPDSNSTGPIPVVAQSGPPAQGSMSSGRPPHKHSRTGAAWVALVVAAVVLVFLLIFVGQNSGSVQVRYLGFEGS